MLCNVISLPYVIRTLDPPNTTLQQRVNLPTNELTRTQTRFVFTFGFGFWRRNRKRSSDFVFVRCLIGWLVGWLTSRMWTIGYPPTYGWVACMHASVGGATCVWRVPSTDTYVNQTHKVDNGTYNLESNFPPPWMKFSTNKKTLFPFQIENFATNVVRCVVKKKKGMRTDTK